MRHASSASFRSMHHASSPIAEPGEETHKSLSLQSREWDIFSAAGANKPSLGFQLQLHELLVRSRCELCPEPLAGGDGCAAFAALFNKYVKRQQNQRTVKVETRGLVKLLKLKNQENDTNTIFFRFHKDFELILTSFESSTSTLQESELTGPRTLQKINQHKNEQQSSRIGFRIQGY